MRIECGYVSLTEEVQKRLYEVLYNACKTKDITTGFASVRAQLMRDMIAALGNGSCTVADILDIRDLAIHLEVSDDVEKILEDAVPLSGAMLSVVEQLRGPSRTE